MNKKLSIIIPAFNEKNTIVRLLKKINQVDLGVVKKEVIIIDDYSTDGTRELLQKLPREYYKIVYHSKNQGKGSAIRTGISQASGDIILIQDADLEYDPQDYPRLIQPIFDKQANVVYGSRVLGSKNKAGMFFYIGGRSLSFLTNMLYGTNITDEPTCYKVFHSNVLKNISLTSKRFEFCPEVTAKIAAQGIGIREVPISYNPRSIKEGKKIRFKDGAQAVWILIKYRIIFSFQNLKSNKYAWWAFIFSIVNIGAFFAFYANYFIEQPDTQTYVSTAKYLSGDSSGELYLQRILKPLAPILMAPFAWLGIAKWGLFIQSLIFYFLSVYLIFRIVNYVYQNSCQAFYAVILFVGAYPLLNSGLSFLTDMSGWFFYILSVWLTLLFLKKKNKNLIFWNGFLVGLGMLFKENTAVAGIFFVIIMLSQRDFTWSDKIKNIGWFSLMFAIPVGISSLIIYNLFHYSYWHWYKFNMDLTETNNYYTLGTILINGAVTFGLAWFYLFRGLIKELKEKNWARLKILIALLPSSLSFFLWPFPLARMMYISAPLLVLLGSYGLMFNGGKKYHYISAILLALYLFVNYSIPYFNTPEIKNLLISGLNYFGITTTPF